MNIHVSGKQVTLSDALKHRVNTHLNTLTGRYFDKAFDAKVTFSKIRSFFTCDINVHAGRGGIILRGEGEGADANVAFDDAAEHIAKRLRRHHQRITSHTRADKTEQPPETGRSYILDAETSFNESKDITPPPEEASFPVIIAGQATDIPFLSVSEAVMRLDLAGSTLLLFRNSKNQEINVIFRRSDGNIGWIDTGPA